MRDDLAVPGEDGQPRIDHIGIAVKSLERGLQLYAADLGCEASPAVEVDHEQVRVVMIRFGETRIELLEATSDDSPVGKFIARRGEGIHHVAIKVKDLDAAVERLRASGRRLVTNAIQSSGAEGYRYIFIHPKSAGGVLLELIEAEPG
jgi:methylmalonyl-CoA epimerase